MPAHLLIAGGGIGGLAAGLALAQRGQRLDLLEQAEAFTEIGAGIQLGPNVTRRLRTLGVLDALTRVAARPEALVIASADTGAELARMPLGDSMERKYGAPYLCAHRADLHGVLLAALRDTPGATLTNGVRLTDVVARDEGVCVAMLGSRAWEGDALIGADGLWSQVRQHVVTPALPPHATHHTAWRAMVPRDLLPPRLRSVDVQAWLGARLHVVAYPVRLGQWLNVVVIAEAEHPGDVTDWDLETSQEAMYAAIGDRCDGVRPLLDAVPGWRAWTLHDRPPLTSASEMVQGRIALLGDAAHPMVPYLAQGAGMAIEDAVALGEAVGESGAAELPAALLRYATARWQRDARIQARARRNGEVFHATGSVRVARDAALRVMGAHLLDAPWLYSG